MSRDGKREAASAASLTAKQLERGLSLARAERESRWAWGEWAVDVAGSVGESRENNDAIGKLRIGLEELAEHGDIPMRELPGLDSLRDYRAAADAIPPKLRKQVTSVYVGKALATVKDIRERHELIERLATEHPKGVVTVDAVRRATGARPTRPTMIENRLVAEGAEVEAKAQFASELLADREVAEAVVESSTVGSRRVRNAVRSRNAKDREKAQRRNEKSANDGALPLPAWVPEMIEKISYWAAEMGMLTDDIALLPEETWFRGSLIGAVEDLHGTTDDWLVALGARDPERELDRDVPISGKAVAR